VYQSGNLVDLTRSGKLEGRPAAAGDFSPAVMVDALRMKPAAAVTLDSAQDAFAKVIDSAGDSLHRDSVDQSLIDDVKSLGTKGQIIKSPADGGFKTEIPPVTAPKDSGNHAIESGAAATKVGADGYTDLERYVNGLTAAKS
jgi:hypothetical protein